MTTNNNNNKQTAENSILIPKGYSMPEKTRPTLKLGQYNNKYTSNENNQQTPSSLESALSSLVEKINHPSPNQIEKIVLNPITENNSPNQQTTSGESSDNKNELDTITETKSTITGTRFFKFPNQEIPIGSTMHLAKWKSLSNYEVVAVKGNETEYVEFANWHLNGAKVWIGTSATNATEKVGTNPATGTTGLIPNAIQELAKLTSASRRLSQNGKDAEQREFQFGIICVLGGQDHAALMKDTLKVNMNRDFAESFRAAGAPNASLRAALFNDMGKIIAFEVNLGNPEKFGRGKHLLFLHPANDIGGGKSDESLTDGRLSFQANSLGREFSWWKAALEFGNGKIGSIETTLGGTARLGRYALLSARIPRTLLSPDATEVLNIDPADWVSENLHSQSQEYRANFATTLLRTVWGNAGARFKGTSVTLVDRSDFSMRQTHRSKSSIAILRHLFLGHSDMDLLRGDISDERIATKREESITSTEFMTIYNPGKSNTTGPWDQHRRVRISTTIQYSPGKLLSMARAEDPQTSIDDAEIVLENLRGLATSREDTLPAGGFLVVDAMVPCNMLENDSKVNDNTISKAIELLGKGLEYHGVEKVLINLYKIPKEFSQEMNTIKVQITEDQPGTNVLMVSTEEVGTHEKRTILQNPNLDSISNNKASQVYSFGRLLGRMVTAHKISGYRFCEEDGDLIEAFHRHYYGGRYGHRPNLMPGGDERKRMKESNN